MTTLAAARTALVSVVGASDDYVAPPACQVYSGGSDLTGPATQVQWTFRVAAYVGIGQTDSAAASVELSAYVATLLVALRSTKYAVLSVGPDVVRTIAGGNYLSADILVSIMVEI